MQKNFAVIGCGFWSGFQIPAWLEIDGAHLVAVCDQSEQKASERAKAFGIPRFYTLAEEMFDKENLDFVDIITDVDTHSSFTRMACERGIAVICQKPMAPTLDQAKRMVKACEVAGVPFFIHENWRWQKPMRRVKEILDQGHIGRPFKARITFCSSFPVFENQPFLAELDEFILTDVGSHILDVARFMFGEMRSIYCKTATINPGIRGEDVANVFLETQSGLHCYCEMSYASKLEDEHFPETYLLIEGEKGSIRLGREYEISITTSSGIDREKVKLPTYTWSDPDYDLIHGSIVDANRDIFGAIAYGKNAETTGSNNLETVKLVFGSYASARSGNKIEVSSL